MEEEVIQYWNFDHKLHLCILLEEVGSSTPEPSDKSPSSSIVMSFIMLKFTALAVSLMSGGHVKDQYHEKNEAMLLD
jgi:hypothetical protein